MRFDHNTGFKFWIFSLYIRFSIASIDSKFYLYIFNYKHQNLNQAPHLRITLKNLLLPAPNKYKTSTKNRFKHFTIQPSTFYLWIKIEHMLASLLLGPSQNSLPSWCFNIMPSTFIEGLYKKEPHEAHFCICCEISIRTLSIKLLNVPYLKPT